jgi:PIN domain nuclease of toxin-antitoxin system
MNGLLDTHAFLWAAFSPEKLSARARKEIRSAENRISLSTVSLWEISLKFALGKLELKNCTPENMAEVATEMQIEIVAPTAQESASFYRLPKATNKDPFDRMIIWQAIQGSLILVSKDAAFPEYEAFGLKTIW